MPIDPKHHWACFKCGDFSTDDWDVMSNHIGSVQGPCAKHLGVLLECFTAKPSRPTCPKCGVEWCEELDAYYGEKGLTTFIEGRPGSVLLSQLCSKCRRKR